MECAVIHGFPLPAQMNNEKNRQNPVKAPLWHNASLIHDDVVDESKQRRGKPTINGVWDNRIACLLYTSTPIYKGLSEASFHHQKGSCTGKGNV